MSLTCQNCQETWPDDFVACPHCGRSLGESPGAVLTTMPSFLPPGFEPEPVDPSSQTWQSPEVTPIQIGPSPSQDLLVASKHSKGNRLAGVWIVPVVIVAVVLVVALVWTFARPGSPLGGGTPAEPASPAAPASPPVATCNPQQGGDMNPLNKSNFELGGDEIPSVIVLVHDLSFECYGTIEQGGFTGVTVHYGPGAKPPTLVVLSYVMWLRDFGGFLQGPFASTADVASGILWRPSVDAGLVIRLDYSADASGIYIRVTKGPFPSLSGGLPDPSPPDVAPTLGQAVPMLTLTPAKDWARYPTWEYFTGDADLYVPGRAMAFAKVVEGGLVGTMLVYCHDYDAPTTWDDSLQDMAWALSVDFHPQPGSSQTGPINMPPTSTTVGGYPALQFGYLWHDTQFQWYVIQVGRVYFVVLAVVSPSAVPNPADEVDAMVASIVIK